MVWDVLWGEKVWLLTLARPDWIVALACGTGWQPLLIEVSLVSLCSQTLPNPRVGEIESRRMGLDYYKPTGELVQTILA